MTERPGRLVLLGHPLGHSLSPLFQNAALRSAGIPLTYELLDVPPTELERTVDSLVAQRASGNVTIPYKTDVYEMTHGRTDVAERAGAVNTFWVENGKLLGDNTDVAGFQALVQDALGSLGPAARVALLGSGGAARAVLTAVERWRGVHVRVASRNDRRRVELVERFANIAESADSVEDAVRNATMVINATPIGMLDDHQPVPVNALPRRAIVIDLVYRPGGTTWVNLARGNGHIAADGKVMLLAQGAAAFERWFGIRPDVRAMRQAIA